MFKPTRNWSRSTLTANLLALAFLAMAGCQVMSVVATMASKAHQPPKYTGLGGQTAAVMVWADRAIKIEWPGINSDLGNAIQNKLYGNPAKELKDTKWPWPADSVVGYQIDHPGIEALPVTDVAPKIGVSRVIYVEIQQFTTRGEASSQMFRGNISATLKVIEVEGKQGKIGYEETGITTHFPKKSPPEGVLNSNDGDIYRGTVAALAQEITDRLAGYEPE